MVITGETITTMIGLTRIGLAPVFFVASLNHISAGFEGLVITLIPVVTAAMARVALGEMPRRVQTVGLSLGLAGTALLILSGETGIADGSGSTIVGGALALGGVFFGSVSGVLSRRYAPRHDTTALAVPMFVSGTAVAVAAGLGARDVELGSLTARSWQIVIALALAATLLPFVATLYASRHTYASNVALTGYLAPIVAVIGGVVLLDEVVTVALVAGGTITLVGVVLAARAAPRLPDLVE